MKDDFGTNRAKRFRGIVDRAKEMQDDISGWFNQWLSKQTAESLEKEKELPKAETITMGIPEATLNQIPQVSAEERAYYKPYESWYDYDQDHDSYDDSWKRSTWNYNRNDWTYAERA